jgi:hypothetical protein
MKTAINMTIAEFEAHLKKQREALFDAREREDTNHYRNPNWNSAVLSAHSVRASMKRRGGKWGE